MDLETENRIARILMKEAADLRRQAEKEGVHVYLQQPKARVRPNPRFLTATVLGVQQANRAVEVNEMWRVRQKEMELDNRLKPLKSRDQRFNCGTREYYNSRESSNKRLEVNGDNCAKASSSSTRDNGGLKDEELEEFLHSRVKRGRGAIGSRMDETGPYLPRESDSNEALRSSDIIQSRAFVGPEKPKSYKRYDSSEEETDDDSDDNDDDDDDDDDRREKKRRRVHSSSSKKRHPEKHRSKSRSKDKDKKRKRKDEKSSRRKK